MDLKLDGRLVGYRQVVLVSSRDDFALEILQCRE